MIKPKILAFSGSKRTGSFNKKLIAIAAKGAKDAGGDVTLLDLNEYDLPIYDGDLEAEEGIPENGKELKALFKSHHGILISSPEYNSSISPLLKNVIDWVSRPEPGEPSLVAFSGKVAGLVSASPGGLGGLRGLVHLRSILGNIQVIVIPDQATIPVANEAFKEDGSLIDAKKEAQVRAVGARLVEVSAKLLA